PGWQCPPAPPAGRTRAPPRPLPGRAPGRGPSSKDAVASALLLPPAVGIIRFELPELEPIRLRLRRQTHPLPGACQAPVTSPSSSYVVKQIASGCCFKNGARSSSSHTFHVAG